MNSSHRAGLHRPFQLLQPWGVTLCRLIKMFGRPSCVQNNSFETRSAMLFQGFLAQCYPTVGAGYCTLSSSFVFLRFWFVGDTAAQLWPHRGGGSAWGNWPEVTFPHSISFFFFFTALLMTELLAGQSPCKFLVHTAIQLQPKPRIHCGVLDLEGGQRERFPITRGDTLGFINLNTQKSLCKLFQADTFSPTDTQLHC